MQAAQRAEEMAAWKEQDDMANAEELRYRYTANIVCLPAQNNLGVAERRYSTSRLRPISFRVHWMAVGIKIVVQI